MRDLGEVPAAHARLNRAVTETSSGERAGRVGNDDSCQPFGKWPGNCRSDGIRPSEKAEQTNDCRSSAPVAPAPPTLSGNQCGPDKYGFVDVLRALHLTSYRAAGRRFLTALGRDVAPDRSRAERVRLTCEELGPTFIKFGQALSLRADLLPQGLVTELERLQDAVAPLAPGVAEQAVEAAFGRPLRELFAEFSPTPLASAWNRQVHQARLHSGEVVAVKVRRPGIDSLIESDLAILRSAAMAERRFADAKLYSLPGLVNEFARTIRREQDLAREGRLIDRVARQFAGNPDVRLPKVYWRLTNESVLTLEYLDGVRVTAVGTSEAPIFYPGVVARRGADAILEQILVHGLFHADPHPGNILVLPGNVVGFIDFGIIGRVNAEMREQLARVIIAVNRHDAAHLAEIVTTVTTACGQWTWDSCLKISKRCWISMPTCRSASCRLRRCFGRLPTSCHGIGSNCRPMCCC